MINSLLRELSVYLGVPDSMCEDTEALLRYGFGDKKVFHTLLATANARPVGVIIFYPEFSTWRGCPGAYILDLYICDEYRGSSLGKQLVSTTRQFAKEMWDANYLRLAVHTHNRSAIRFYQKLGFSMMEDEHLMVLSE